VRWAARAICSPDWTAGMAAERKRRGASAKKRRNAAAKKHKDAAEDKRKNPTSAPTGSLAPPNDPAPARPQTLVGTLKVSLARIATEVAEAWSGPSVVFDRVMLGLLVCAAVPVALLSVGFAPQRFFGEPIPVVAVLAGLANAVLLWLAAGFTGGVGRVAPLIVWLLTLMVAAMAGPGHDVVLPLDGTTVLPTFLLVVVGAGLPLALLWSGRLNTGPR
jgi:hypothetical protein